MRSKIDARFERRGRGGKPRSPVGGKALQRLFAYLGRRNPTLNDEVVAAVAVPKAARPKFGLTKRALRAKAPTPTIPTEKPTAYLLYSTLSILDLCPAAIFAILAHLLLVAPWTRHHAVPPPPSPSPAGEHS